MSLQRRILSPVTTAGMLYPVLHTEIMQIAMPNMVCRQFFQPFTLTASNSVVFPKESGSAAAVVQRIAEGTEIPLDVTPYSQVVVVPYKIAHGFLITQETIEDSLIPVQTNQMSRAALRFANKVDKDCLSVIQTGTGSTVAATGKSLAFDGTEFVLSGSGGPGIGVYDIIDAKNKVEAYNKVPDSLLVHPYVKGQIEKLPHFTSLAHYGEAILQEGFIQKAPGKFGDILGLDAFSSTNCPTGSAYVLNRGRSPNILKQYSPLGYFVERRGITTKLKALVERDSIGVFITSRYAPAVTDGENICSITGINTS